MVVHFIAIALLVGLGILFSTGQVLLILFFALIYANTGGRFKIDNKKREP